MTPDGGKGLTEEVESVLCSAISRTCTGRGGEGCARQRGWVSEGLGAGKRKQRVGNSR